MLAYCAVIDDRQQQQNFETMYYHYRRLLYQVANDILRDHYLAEDAVSQTFWKAAEHMDSIAQPVCPRTTRFLTIICERTAIDLYRRQRNRDCASLDALEFDLPDPNVPLQPEEEGTLAAAMARLPKTCREVIFLRFADDRPVGEIAQLLDMTEANVYKYIQRGKKKLEQLLQEEGLS